MSYQVLLACKSQLVSLHFHLSHIIYHFPFYIFILNFIYYLYCYCSYCQASNAMFQGFSSAQPTRSSVVVFPLHCRLCYCIVVIVLYFRYKAYEPLELMLRKEWCFIELYLLSLERFKYAKCLLGMLTCNGFNAA